MTSTGDILPGNSFTVGLTIPVASSGAYSGSITFDRVSDGNGIDNFGTTDLGDQTVLVNGTVFNYATATIENLSGSVATLSGGGSAYTLNFGQVLQGSTAKSVSLDVRNTASGTADQLAGGFVVANASGVFGDSGFNAFGGLAAGAAQAGQSIVLNTGTAGVFTQTITLNGTGSDPGYSGAVTPETLTVVGTVVVPSFGQAVARLNTPGPIDLGNQRVGDTPLTAPIWYTNVATPPAEIAGCRCWRHQRRRVRQRHHQPVAGGLHRRERPDHWRIDRPGRRDRRIGDVRRIHRRLRHRRCGQEPDQRFNRLGQRQRVPTGRPIRRGAVRHHRARG